MVVVEWCCGTFSLVGEVKLIKLNGTTDGDQTKTIQEEKLLEKEKEGFT